MNSISEILLKTFLWKVCSISDWLAVLYLNTCPPWFVKLQFFQSFRQQTAWFWMLYLISQAWNQRKHSLNIPFQYYNIVTIYIFYDINVWRRRFFYENPSIYNKIINLMSDYDGRIMNGVRSLMKNHNFCLRAWVVIFEDFE